MFWARNSTVACILIVIIILKKQEHQPHQNKLNFANQKFAQIMRLTFSGGLSPRLLPVQHILLHRPLEAQACL